MDLNYYYFLDRASDSLLSRGPKATQPEKARKRKLAPHSTKPTKRMRDEIMPDVSSDEEDGTHFFSEGEEVEEKDVCGICSRALRPRAKDLDYLHLEGEPYKSIIGTVLGDFFKI